ncbi:Uma2 family endonuclease [Chamaesiphon sp. VAR_48_metabat_403]|uniref:Uma2 family endonuclease n=1 Tax=Chamaesiphon sp. VAR_48_metabat_403 TaxID=2964700 RepID=UPI00286E333A|nr:Uma2 family endonuclease [Chamaesiphon sp. VAR_48_metabat_403]
MIGFSIGAIARYNEGEAIDSIMVASISLNRIKISVGQKIYLHDVSWEEFEQILLELGEKRATRIAYYAGELEIRMPLPEHERIKVLISNLLVVLLEELDLPWESLGSSTFKNDRMKAGIEPDDCFYLKNCQAIVGKTRLDLTIDPPPDLVIEVDLTSVTQISAYESLGIPEIWRYRQDKLAIFVLTAGSYIESDTSCLFPALPIKMGISQILERSTEILTSEARKEFRQWVKQNLPIDS